MLLCLIIIRRARGRRGRMMGLEDQVLMGAGGLREDGDGGWIRIVGEGRVGAEGDGMGMMGMLEEVTGTGTEIGIEMQEMIVDHREDRDLIEIEVGGGRNVILAVRYNYPSVSLYNTIAFLCYMSLLSLGTCFPSIQSPLLPPLFSTTRTPSILIPLSTLLHIS